MSLYEDYLKKKEEKEKKSLYEVYAESKKPSQIAREEQKIKQPTIKKEPGFIERGIEKAKGVVSGISQGISDLFKPRQIISPIPEPEIPKPTQTRITPDLQKNMESSYLKFPSVFPHPQLDLESKEFGASAQLTPEARDAATKFWSDPIDNSILAAQDFLQYHPKVTEVLAGAQNIVENTPYVGIQQNPLTRGITKGVGLMFLGSSDQVRDTFEKRLNHSTTFAGRTFETVGEVVGGLLSFVAGGAELKALGFGKATLPVLFATLGQTSAPPETTITQRLEKMPVDVAAGWLFSKIPASKTFGKDLFKATGKVVGIGAGQGFLSALIEKKKPEEAAQIAATQGLLMGLFHISGSAMGLLSDEILNSKVKSGEGIFSGQEIRNIVNSTRLEGTKVGNMLIKMAGEADSAGKNIKLNMQAVQKSFVSKKLDLNKPEGLGFNAELVDRPAEIGARPPVEPAKPPTEPRVPIPPRPTKVALVKTTDLTAITDQASKYTSAKDFAESVASAKPTNKIGVLNPKSIVARDPIDATQVNRLKAQITEGKPIEPIEVNYQDGKLTTVDGSQRLTAFQELNKPITVIYRGTEEIAGLRTFEDIYKEKVIQPVAKTIEKPAEVKANWIVEKTDKGWQLRNTFTDVVETTIFKTKQDAESYLQITKKVAKEVKPEVKAISKELESLAKEASGYKSATEFVSASIFEKSLSGVQLSALDKYEGKTVADKLENFYNQVVKEVKPEIKPLAPPTKPVKPTIEEAKKLITPPDKRTQEISDFFQAKYGKPIEKATTSEIKEVLTAPENLPLNEKSDIILKKLTSPAKGVSLRELEYKPNLIYGGIKKNMFTDDFILIKDKAVAKQFNQELVDKKEKEYLKFLQKSSRDLTFEQAEKFAKEETQRQIENSDQNYPKEEDIQKILDIKYSDKEAKVVGFNNIGNVYLYDGETGVMADGNRLAFMQKRLPDSSIRLSGRDSAIVFVKGKEITGLLMPIKFEGAFPFEAGKPKKMSQKAPASIDRYADLPNVTQQEVFKTIPFPEMVRLAKDLTTSYPEIKKPRFRPSLGGRPLGIFIPKEEGRIILNPDIFKDTDQAAKTLAHEIGHLIDYLPDQVMVRGNILGRIGTLRKFLRQKFTSPTVEKRIDELISARRPLQDERRSLRDENGVVTDKKKDTELLRQIKPLNKEIRTLQEKSIKNKEVREELINLSKLWKPYGERTATVDGMEVQITEELSDEYIAYRESPEELYADALSVLVNDPALLKKEAPVFWNNFFDFLDRKPVVKDAYFELMDFLNEPDDVVQTRRLEDLYKGFTEARKKRLEIEKKEKPKKGWLEKVMFQHVTRFDPIYRKLDKISKGYGMELSSKTKLRMQLEEMQMRRNDSYLYLHKVNKDVVVPLEKIGLTEDDLGVMLTLERNLGDRKEIANPYGLQGKYSQEALDFLKTYLQKYRGITDEQFTVLEQVARNFRDYQFKAVEDATNAELYSKEFFEKTAKPNKDTYATYQVIEYIHDNYVSAGVKKATGTLKEIENPFVSSVFKTVAVINQTEIQKGKLAVVKQLQENFADDISKSVAMKARGVRVGWKPVENRSPLELYEDGKRMAYDVDPYMKEMFDLYSPTELHSLVQVSSKFNRVFKPLVTTYNLSWGFYSNISRDTRRSYKNLATLLPKVGEGKGLSIFEFVYRWLTAIPSGVQFQRGKLNSILEEMIENKAYTTSFVSFDGQANEEASIAPVMRKFRFLQPLKDVKNESLLRKMFKPLTKVLEGIEFAASTFETTSKVSGYQIVKSRVKDAKFAGYITRNYVGTPNFIDGGTQKQIDNSVFVFSNVMFQGVRTDLELATNPQTRSGYWFRTFIIDILPKIMMLAAGAGLLGLKVKDEMDKATEYDKTNYLVVPLGTRENGKANYWRIPQDETGRFIGALAWKVGSFINGSLKKPEQIFSLGAGYIPSVTPMWEVAGAWLNYAQGRNPYDNYRGRQVVDDLTWKAGGLPVFEKMIQYTSNQLGLSQFSTYSDETDTTFDTLIKTLPIVNRAFRSTDYGLKEKEQVIKKEIDQENARRILKERELLDAAIKQGKENPENKKEIEKSLIRDALGQPPYDDKQKRRRTNLEKKFKIGLIKGELSREMDSLIEANTNDYKVELLRTYKQSLSMTGYRSLIRDGRKYKVISDELVKQLKKEKLYYEITN